MEQGQTIYDEKEQTSKIYSRPEKFKMVCKKCKSNHCELTITHFSKIEIVCMGCGEKEE